MSRTFLLLALFASTLVAAPVFAARGTDDFDARLKQGAALAARGERAEARALFEELATAHPERPEPLNDLAALAAAEGDLPRARALLERALATDPSYRAVHDNLSAVYAAQAGEAYRRALPLDGALPSNPELAMLEGRAPTPVVEPITVPSVALVTATAPTSVAARAPATIAKPAASALAAARPAVATRPAVPAVDPFDARAFAAFHAVDAWIHAWVKRDVAGYTAAYAREFIPPDGLSRADWEAQRAERIRAPKHIEISIHDRNLVVDSDGKRARMTFTQSYRSDRFTGVSFKTLTLVEQGGRWRIAAERTGR